MNKQKLSQMKDILEWNNYKELEYLVKCIYLLKYILTQSNIKWNDFNIKNVLFNTKICKKEIIEYIQIMKELTINLFEKHSNENFIVNNRFEYSYFFNVDISIKWSASLLFNEIKNKEKFDDSILNEIKEILELVNILKDDYLEIKNSIYNKDEIRKYIEINLLIINL